MQKYGENALKLSFATYTFQYGARIYEESVTSNVLTRFTELSGWTSFQLARLKKVDSTHADSFEIFHSKLLDKKSTSK